MDFQEQFIYIHLWHFFSINYKQILKIIFYIQLLERGRDNSSIKIILIRQRSYPQMFLPVMSNVIKSAEFSGLYFSLFGRNMEIDRVDLRIKSGYSKIKTKNSDIWTLYSVIFRKQTLTVLQNSVEITQKNILL